jgi:cyclase
VIPRVIPVLLLEDGGVVKTVRFKDPRYVGDPINIVRIFNDKQVDELVVLDIQASRRNRAPDVDAVADMAAEAFMPIAYGGGVRDVATATTLIQAGVEKVIVNTAAVEDRPAIAEIANRLGSSTLVASVDARKRGDGDYEVVTHGGTVATKRTVEEHVRDLVDLGAGEVLLTSVDRDGTMAGYDLDLIRSVASVAPTPVVAAGGAGSLADLGAAVAAGASAAAAGSIFVFHGKHRAVLVTYPAYEMRRGLFTQGVDGPAEPASEAISGVSGC